MNMLRKGIACMGVCAVLSGCGPSPDLPPFPSGGGGAGGSGDQTSTGGSSSTGGTQSDNCVATCCDGSIASGKEASAQDCKFYEGFACGKVGGPQSIVFGGVSIWTAASGCPSMAACTANCCDGSLKVQGQQFDADLCNFFAVSDGICDQSGGVAKVFFNNEETLSNVGWNNGQTSCGDCVATCCDGSVVAAAADDAAGCNFWAGVPCNDQGGPKKIEFQGNLSWGPSSCPSTNECKLVCQSGLPLITQEFDKNMCIFFKVGDDYCNDKGGNAAVYYDGALVWQP